MLTLTATDTYLEEIKKSRFIARAARVDSPEDAMRFISEASESDANHNCWAYCVGDAYRFSDDGEPGGTAGRPILAAIQGKGLDHVAVVVTRYFGGIKLGAGGLVRAYGGCAAKCLDRAEKVDIRPKVLMAVEIPFKYKGRLYRVLQDFKCESMHEDASASGLIMSLEIEEEFSESLSQRICDACSGEAIIKIGSPE